MDRRGAQSHQGGGQDRARSRDQMTSRLSTAGGWESQQPGGSSMKLDFQDSNLSPALPLLPSHSGMEDNVTESSLLRKSDMEFAPLRAYPDISIASETFPPQDCTTQSSECGSLSQHPLALETNLSEERAGHGFSLFQLLGEGAQDPIHSSLINTTNDGLETQSIEDSCNTNTDTESQTDPVDKPAGGALEDSTYFLRRDITAQHLLQMLERDVGMSSSSSSSAVSSAAEAIPKSVTSSSEDSKSTKVSTDRSTARREGPPGEASLPAKLDQSRALSSEVSNITTGSRSTQPDDSSDMLLRELLSESDRGSSRDVQAKRQKTPTPPGESVPTCPTQTSGGKLSATTAKHGGKSWTGPFSSGVDQSRKEQHHWSSGTLAGIDGSYLGFLPQSQSTPGFFQAPPKSSVKFSLRRLSAIESNKDNSYESTPVVAQPPADPVANPTSASVQSLPSLNYMQKVDAWRESQSLTKTSLLDSTSRQGFRGVSPKKTGDGAVSDSLNRPVSEKMSGMHQTAALRATDHGGTDGPRAQSASSCPRRAEGVGSVPGEGNRGSAVQRPAPPCGSTVVMSGQNDQQNKSNTAKETSPIRSDVHQQPGAVAQPSPLVSLGRFSDVSPDVDPSSGSPESTNSGIKVASSVGASSVVSLEVDNYAPYWTAKAATPPPPPPPLARQRELNIDERIQMYLHNIGIEQSPSTILNPFAPRGPIREPEFSPTDLCTIKGSVGTPTKSTQPSEGGSPHKGEFSQSSELSADSSVSIPFSLDSVGPAVLVPEKVVCFSSSVTAISQSIHSLTREDSPAATPQTSQQQRDSTLTSTQNAVHQGDRVDSVSSEHGTESPLDGNEEQSQEESNTLLGVRGRSQAGNVESAGSSAEDAALSRSPAAPQLPSDDVLFFALRKKNVQDSSFTTSSSSGEPTTRSSFHGARSSSDSEKPQERSVGPEIGISAGQSAYSATRPTVPAPRAGTYTVPPGGAGSSLVLTKSSRRAEPEGCSSAAPDTATPLQPPADKPPQQPDSTPADTASPPEEENQPTRGGATESSPPSPTVKELEDADHGGMSDGSSESSLAARVARLLQSDSPSTVVSSTPSVTDQEESKTREWVKTKMSRQQCELLAQDQKRIEEIMQELLLENPLKSQGSTDTDSSTPSSASRLQVHHLLPTTETFAAFSAASNRPAAAPQHPVSSTVQLPQPRHLDLDAQIRAIAAREGVVLPSAQAKSKSITTATCRRPPSSSPSASSVPSPSSAPESLHLTELATETKEPHPRQVNPAVGGGSSRESSSEFDSRSHVTSAGSQVGRDAAGQTEQPLPCPADVERGDVKVKGDNTLASKNDESSVPDTSDSGGCHAAEESESSVSSAAESPDRNVPVPHVRLTRQGPKVPDPSIPSTHPPAESSLLPRPSDTRLTHVSSAVSSPDEGVGLSSPPEWNEAPRPERGDASTLFRSAVPLGRTTLQSSRSRPSPRTTNTAAVPVVLPYKPHGSEELFYVLQAEADVSSSTTMESSHTGSDDAVPPHFGSEVLGQLDPGLDRGVSIRHPEGIYSKRGAFRMQEAEHRGARVSADRSSQTTLIGTPQAPHVSVSGTTASSAALQVASSSRDRGTSPLWFTPQSSEPRLPLDVRPQSSSTLDQLWNRFCEQWNVEDSCPDTDRDRALQERLELLTRLTQQTRTSEVSGPDPEGVREGDAAAMENIQRQNAGGADRRHEEVEGGVRRNDPAPVHTWMHPLQEEETPHPSSWSRPVSAAPSAPSASVSTVDTARMLQVFGARRFQRLATSSSLRKLHNIIIKQREEREQPVESVTDESVAVVDCPPSTSAVPPAEVKVVSRGVQAGDLEIVSNATRCQTRDVGTTFPSPSSSVVTATGQRSPDDTPPTQKQKRSRRLTVKAQSVSWFISADDMRSEARKENQPEGVEVASRSEPQRRTVPWREPLRPRQVHEHGIKPQESPLPAEPHEPPPSKTAPSGLTPISLQEALELRRPDFLLRSRQRASLLTVQAEERKLQVAFRREHQLFVLPECLMNLPKPPALLRRAVPRKEMIQRSKRIYENLPEVRRRKQEERRKAEYRSYRLNARLFNKKITDHVLGRRKAWQ